MPKKDPAIVRAAIYPAIGVARVGNSETEWFLGPETIKPDRRPASFFKDHKGALKRQAVRFRIYGLDKHGRVVRELTGDDAKITWRVHVANCKAAWYEFNVALDIPQATSVPLRNANFTGSARDQLVIDPGEATISGANQQGNALTGKFIGENVYLGELRTDDKGRLIFLGGHGKSSSPFPDNPPTTFANNDGWHDDTSDGPIDADVEYGGQTLPVEGAWVVTAPPNYAPDIISVQTMYDVMVDTLTGYYLPKKSKPSFTHDIYPLLLQLTQNQWVNKGFYVGYGKSQAYDFDNPELIKRLATGGKDSDAFRMQIFNYFRPPTTAQISPQLWPWMYGDNMNVPVTTPNGYFTITGTLYGYLQQWAAGNFDEDWSGDPHPQPQTPQEEADMLTKSALWYCLGGPFHPGCEMTWPMRLIAMYTGPFRIRRRSANNPVPDYGPQLEPTLFQNQNYFTTPIGVFWNGPGDITRWMACPWQTDTASCRAGYEPTYDPLIPTFWPARVPNTVLKQSDYEIVIDKKKKREERLDAFNRRASWYRILGANYLDSITNMIERFGDLGVVGWKEGVKDDPVFPREMYVESPPYAPGEAATKALKVQAEERHALAKEAEESIPDDRGLVVGPVGRAVRGH
jgi:hypothetical protein